MSKMVMAGGEQAKASAKPNGCATAAAMRLLVIGRLAIYFR